MRRTRICIYGGTDLQGAPLEFISELAYTILKSIPSVIITGGFVHSNQEPNAISTDVAALEGARKYAKENFDDLKKCFEAWIPEPSLDKRPDIKGAVRMSEAHGVNIRVMQGRTPLGRRLAMVASVDLLLTISGRRHTEVVVEQALELGIPVLPIPEAGGDSEELLNTYRGRIATAFAPGALTQCLDILSKTIRNNRRAEAAAAVVELIRTAKVGRCLVLLPFDEEHNSLYSSFLEPAISRHMMPVRLDRLPGSEAIYTSFADAVRTSSAVIADITLLNENVMYEIGYVHGLGITPLIYTREASRRSELPVYFRTLNVRLESPDTPLVQLVDEYLHSFRIKKTGNATG